MEWDGWVVLGFFFIYMEIDILIFNCNFNIAYNLIQHLDKLNLTSAKEPQITFCEESTLTAI